MLAAAVYRNVFLSDVIKMDFFRVYPKKQHNMWFLVLENATIVDVLRSFQFLAINETQ